MNEIWSGKKILVIDDSDMVRSTLCNLYRELGLEVVNSYARAEKALIDTIDLQVDLVSLDIILPDMHGIDCYRRMKEKSPNLKIFFVSCLCQDKKIIQSFANEIPAVLFQPKPPEIDQLKEMLSGLWGGEKD